MLKGMLKSMYFLVNIFDMHRYQCMAKCRLQTNAKQTNAIHCLYAILNDPPGGLMIIWFDVIST